MLGSVLGPEHLETQHVRTHGKQLYTFWHSFLNLTICYLWNLSPGYVDRFSHLTYTSITFNFGDTNACVRVIKESVFAGHHFGDVQNLIWSKPAALLREIPKSCDGDGANSRQRTCAVQGCWRRKTFGGTVQHGNWFFLCWLLRRNHCLGDIQHSDWICL